MAEAVKVIVRCRPMNQREKDLKCEAVVEMESGIGQCYLHKPKDRTQPPKTFTFDGAYYMDSTTETIYNDICFPLVEGVLEGYNGTVFAYGQTGCGKSFSMMGITDPPTQRGIIPRAFEHIFETIQVSEDSKFLVHASYLEIYNEEIRDLLGKDHKAKLELKEHPERGVYVKDLSMAPVNNVIECERVMDLGGKNRSVGSTLMNADSSRSHSIFTINLEILDTGADGGEHIRAGKLNLVDLAGSERQAKTGATGDRLKEATKINLSLSALGNVISALVDGKSKHIPYRDSKLTRLLQDSLGGNTKTLMVACLSPADNNYDETLSTLRYANRAKNIKNKPHINEDPKDALLREYQEEIENLKKMLLGQLKIPSELLAGGNSAIIPVTQPSHHDYSGLVAKETEQVKQEYETKLAEMKTMYEVEQMSKQKLQEEMAVLKDEYNSKVHAIEEHYHAEEDTVAGRGQDLVSVTPTDGSSISMINTASAEVMRRMSSADGELDHNSVLTLVSGPLTQATIDAAFTEDPSLMQKAQQAALKGVQELNVKATALKGMQDQLTLKAANVTHDVQQEALKRLAALQEKMVGGEKKNDQKLKERHKERKAYALSKRQKLLRSVKKMDDDGIMVKVYDSMQDEIRDKTAKVEQLDQALKSARNEIDDIQVEFERDRSDYLDAIRKQEQMIKLQQQLLDKIQPCIRRDCNYYNLDKIRGESKWDEETGKWSIPELVVTKTTLPTPGIMPGGNARSGGRKSPINRSQINNQGQLVNGYPGYSDEPEEDKFRSHLSKSSNADYAASYFKPKRAEKLLAQTSKYDRQYERTSPPTLTSSRPSGIYPTNGQHSSFGPGPGGQFGGSSGGPYLGGPPTSLSEPLGLQHLEGGRPVRLESLNVANERGSRKKKKNKQMNFEHFGS